jgi:PAS domain-containing protein
VRLQKQRHPQFSFIRVQNSVISIRVLLQLPDIVLKKSVPLIFGISYIPDYRDVVRERGIARQRGDNVPSRYEFPIITKFGETRWIDFSAGVVEYERKPAALGTTFDITERKRTEELHQKRNEEVIRFQTALLALGKKHHRDLHETLRTITETNAKILHVACVRIWLYSDDRTKITCEEMYRLYENDHERGMEMETHFYPKYFSSLQESRILAAADARNDERTNEFTEPYVVPYGISSMLDVPNYCLSRVCVRRYQTKTIGAAIVAGTENGEYRNISRRNCARF